MQIVWTEPALRDLASARAYVARGGSATADHQVHRILTAVAGLTRFPETGRPGRVGGTRELVVLRTPYLVAYRVRNDTVEILRVLHGRQRWPDGL